MPIGLTLCAWISIIAAGVCALIIVLDLLRGHRQHMWIMNVVWPITALYAGPLALWGYYRFGRQSGHAHSHDEKSFPVAVALAATHCGSGCTLGDLISEWMVFVFPQILIWFGYGTLFSHPVFASWVLDFVLAFIFGIAFQYFTIVPMRKLSPMRGIIEAVKADALSLIAWQIGMYGWMAIVIFGLFGHDLAKTSPVFWLMMQVAMLCGFATSYPVNWWLVRAGIKEKM
jgi:hypothetical protein